MVQKLTEGMRKRVSFDVTFINMPNYNIVSKLQACSYHDITFIIVLHLIGHLSIWNHHWNSWRTFKLQKTLRTAHTKVFRQWIIPWSQPKVHSSVHKDCWKLSFQNSFCGKHRFECSILCQRYPYQSSCYLVNMAIPHTSQGTSKLVVDWACIIGIGSRINRSAVLYRIFALLCWNWSRYFHLFDVCSFQRFCFCLNIRLIWLCC